MNQNKWQTLTKFWDYQIEFLFKCFRSYFKTVSLSVSRTRKQVLWKSRKYQSVERIIVAIPTHQGTHSLTGLCESSAVFKKNQFLCKFFIISRLLFHCDSGCILYCLETKRTKPRRYKFFARFSFSHLKRIQDYLSLGKIVC